MVGQLRNVPADATHLIVSVGGNDALRNMSVLDERAASMAAAVERLSDIAAEFRKDYQAMLAAVGERGLPGAGLDDLRPALPQ